MNMRRVYCFVAALFLGGYGHAEDKLWYGLLHAHTSYSDGSGVPEDAYKRAKSKGVDFFAVTEHNHSKAESGAGERQDGLLISTNPELYTSDELIPIDGDGIQHWEKSVMRAARETTAPTFVALYGQEFSSISSGNHVNVLGIDHVLTIPNGDYRGLFSHLASLQSGGAPPIVVQLNHPGVYADLFYSGAKEETRQKMYNDYGLDDYERNFSLLVAASDAYVSLVEVLSGPSATKDKKFERYRYDDHGDDYYFYLTQGFHVSPSAGHDNHYKHWGDKSPARTGVYAPELTVASLFDAMRNNRTFATEDSDLAVDLSINGTAMGGVLMAEQDTPLTIEALVNDAGESDTTFDVTLVYGAVAPQREGEFATWRESDGAQETEARAGNGSVRFDGFVAGSGAEFFYVVVEEGEGNRAWSAPVWLNHPRTTGTPPAVDIQFVWTKNRSTYYHHPWCTAAGKILPHNRREGVTPPEGRQLHGCVRGPNSSEH